MVQFLGTNLHLVGCTTVCTKSGVILNLTTYLLTHLRVAATKVGSVAVALQNLGLLYNLGICMDETATCLMTVFSQCPRDNCW